MPNPIPTQPKQPGMPPQASGTMGAGLGGLGTPGVDPLGGGIPGGQPPSAGPKIIKVTNVWDVLHDTLKNYKGKEVQHKKEQPKQPKPKSLQS